MATTSVQAEGLELFAKKGFTNAHLSRESHFAAVDQMNSALTRTQKPVRHEEVRQKRASLLAPQSVTE
jgi:hypothetical protein